MLQEENNKMGMFNKNVTQRLEVNNGNSGNTRVLPLYPTASPPRNNIDPAKSVKDAIDAASHVNRLNNGAFVGFARPRDPSQESNGSRIDGDKLYGSVNFPDIVIS